MKKSVLNARPIVEERVARIQRAAYLKSKGIQMRDQLQLNLMYPDVMDERDDLRHIPNDYGRSSLFTVRSKRTKRRTLVQEKLFHYNKHITILYTGIELRAEDDELVWMQILNYGKSVPLGQPFEFLLGHLVSEVGWHKNGHYYNKARQCISRLKANEVLALNDKAYGTSGAVSLIQNYTAVNDETGKPTRYRVWIDPNLIVMFAGNTFTSHSWEKYRALSPVARRLTDYIESHKQPFPLDVKKFQNICGSDDASIRSWRQTVRKACSEVIAAEIVGVASLSSDDKICCADKSSQRRGVGQVSRVGAD